MSAKASSIFHASILYVLTKPFFLSLPAGACEDSVHVPEKNLQPFVSTQKSAKKVKEACLYSEKKTLLCNLIVGA